MSKKIAFLFLIVFLGGLFFPLTSLAVAGTYIACPREYPFYHPDKGKCCAKIEGEKCFKPDGTEFGGVDHTDICYEGLVPCGLKKPIWEDGSIGPDGRCVGTKIEEGISCQFCHFFVILDGIVDFILFKIVPYLAVLMIVIGGIMFYFGGAKPDLMSRGKSLIKGVIIGLFLIYGAFMIVGTFLLILGVAEWTNLSDWASKGSFQIACQIY